MRTRSRITLTAAFAGALALVAAPAFAVSAEQTVDLPPWSWEVGAGNQWGIFETTFDDNITTVSDAWDFSQMAFLGPGYIEPTGALESTGALEPSVAPGFVPFQCVSSTVTVDGADTVITCSQATTTSWGLSVTSNVRVYGPGDLSRTVFFVTNTTSAPVALGYEFFWNYGESSGHVRSTAPGVVQDTGNDDGFLAFPDVWSYNVGDGTLNAGTAWGLTGQPLLGTESEHSGYDEATVTLMPSVGRTIAAGETVALAFFQKVQEPEVQEVPASVPAAEGDVAEMPVPQPASSHLGETPASFMSEFSSFSGRLTRGLPADISVGNWQPVADPELADTGAGLDEQLFMGGIAAALLGTGTALFALRRFTVRSARR